MSEKEAGKGQESAGEKGFRTPGLRGAQTTTLFRAVNPELFIKPVRLSTFLHFSINYKLQMNKNEQFFVPFYATRSL